MEKKELRKITKEELDMIIKKHKRWLVTYRKEGESADLSYVDLSYASLCGMYLFGANLSGANLSWTNLSGATLPYANLQGADLRYTNLAGANLTGVNLEGADLSYADLTGADLPCANLSHADLAFADLSRANLSGANLKYAYLVGANLTSADLKDANLNDAELTNANLTDAKNFPNIPMACPDSGSFIGWKHAGNHIVKLEIPEDAKRSSGTGEKCRCNKARILAIENDDETPADVTEVCSDHDKNFIYKVGETVIVDDFDDNRFNECVPGIHFYMDRDSAVSCGY